MVKPESDSSSESEFVETPRYLAALRNFKVPVNPAWSDVIKVLHNDSYPFLLPAQELKKVGQLLYVMNIGGYDVLTLLDLGASHSFITRDWVQYKDLDLTPIRPPRPVGLFSGQRNYIRHAALNLRVKFREHERPWNFMLLTLLLIVLS